MYNSTAKQAPKDCRLVSKIASLNWSLSCDLTAPYFCLPLTTQSQLQNLDPKNSLKHAKMPNYSFIPHTIGLSEVFQLFCELSCKLSHLNPLYNTNQFEGGKRRTMIFDIMSQSERVFGGSGKVTPSSTMGPRISGPINVSSWGDGCSRVR